MEDGRFEPTQVLLMKRTRNVTQPQNVKISLTHHFDSNEEKLLMQLEQWRCKGEKKNCTISQTLPQLHVYFPT